MCVCNEKITLTLNPVKENSLRAFRQMNCNEMNQMGCVTEERK